MIRAKFHCNYKSVNQDGTATVNMSAVTSGSEENDKFFAATPSGQLDMHVLNPEAASQFEGGKDYYLDISLVEV